MLFSATESASALGVVVSVPLPSSLILRTPLQSPRFSSSLATPPTPRPFFCLPLSFFFANMPVSRPTDQGWTPTAYSGSTTCA